MDPVFQNILLRPGAFFWSGATQALKTSGRFDDAYLRRTENLMAQAQDAGLADGIGVSIVNAQGEIAGIGVSRPTPETEHPNVQELADVHLLALVLYEKYMSFFVTRALPKLTPREKDVLSWSASGKTDPEIADILGIAAPTVRFHWGNIFQKMGVHSKMSATIKAVRQKLIIPDGLRPTRSE